MLELNKLRPVFIVLLLAVFLGGCSDDESSKTFLENNAGSNWKYFDTDVTETIYARINNNKTTPFDIWISDVEFDCFIQEGIDDTGSLDIIKNSENILAMLVIDNPHEYAIITITISGDSLTVVNERFENELLDEKDVLVFNRTTDNIDDLVICPS